MPRKILSVNAGSSSVKVTFYIFQNPPVPIAEAQVSGITAPPPTFKYQRGSTNTKEKLEEQINSPQDSFKYILHRCFNDPELSDVASKADLAYICHRVVHGGDYGTSADITDETLHHLEDLEDLAPLHNSSALKIIRLCQKELPGVTSITYFDSAFHRTLPDYVKTYPINQEVARANGLRKYGFHGISYAFILRAVAQYLGKPVGQTNLIAMHLGSGASICAIKDGKSFDTSMGLTPLAGLPGATRSGDIDPSLVFHYTNEAGKLSSASTKDMHISTAEEILNKQSGWKALTGTTDFGEIAVEPPPSNTHRLAFDILVDRLLGYIGSFHLKLDGQVDALVFAGGIGEKSALLRETLCRKCRSLGVSINPEKNDKGPADNETVKDISKGPGKGPRVLICQTNEQFEMAFHCVCSRQES